VLLEELYCGNDADDLPFNTFTQLDLSQNVNLYKLHAPDLYFLEGLNLSNNTSLVDILIYNSPMDNLNLKNGNNTILTTVYVALNENLFCIEVDDEIAANNGDPPYSGWVVDPQITYSEDCQLGVEENVAMGLLVYPNPVQDVLFIENNLSVAIQSLKMYDLLGQMVLSEKKDFNQINLSVLRAGVYFLTVEMKSGLVVRKIVKE